jgi:hypothetical protein
MADSRQCLRGNESTIVCVNINREVSDRSLKKKERILVSQRLISCTLNDNPEPIPLTHHPSYHPDTGNYSTYETPTCP